MTAQLQKMPVSLICQLVTGPAPDNAYASRNLGTFKLLLRIGANPECTIVSSLSRPCLIQGK